MITGLCQPTVGQILVDDHDIIKETNKARSQLGYCPQHNLLFNELTVFEHLKFFSKLKQNYDDAEINSMLESLNLTEKRNCLSKTLSGGQKRKLCVAIAFIGGSKIVILGKHDKILRFSS
jgi:ATP-binding cassette subfamily A (ABC1) protein 3